LESGRTPQSLEGSYTGIVEAKRAVEAYVAEKEQEKAKKVEEEARKAAEEEARRAEFAIKRAEAKKKVEKAQKEEAIKLDNA
jgi:membrane protein involved in colicin uptake